MLRLPTVEPGNVPGLALQETQLRTEVNRQHHLHELASAQHPQSNAEVHFLFFVPSPFFHWNINTGETVKEEMCDPEQK